MTGIPGYKLVETLYTSRYSLVFRGVWEAGGGLPVIVKTFRRELPEAEEVERLRQEYALLMKAGADAVAQPYELVKLGSTQALVVEDFGGEALNRLDLAGKIGIKEFLGLAIQIATALHVLHSKGVVHKDVNPANVVWNRKTNLVRLVDLNIAAEIVPSTNSVPNSGCLEGTLPYLPPEQTGRINRSVDPRSDLYSFGATLCQLLTGQPPFRAADMMEMVHAHIALPPEAPRNRRADAPGPVSDIILKLLSKRPEDRYQTALGVKADLMHCLSMLEARGSIPDFPLGRNDFSAAFRIPEDLYGRDEEMKRLLALFEDVSSTGRTAVAMVAGGPGTGKSSLVQELYGRVVKEHGHFASGKFNEQDRNVPYASLVAAFSDLLKQILASSQERLDEWKVRLSRALGETAAVLAEVLPDLELVLGKQPPAQELAANEAQNRFNYAVLQFVQAVATPERPLVMFLDDLQWADPGSFRLVELMMTDPDVRNILLIGAYRDNEVGQWHPLAGLLDRIRRGGKVVETIAMEPLPGETIAELLGDALRAEGDDAAQLAQACLDKTGGNPFFLGQFLRSLYEDRLLWFDTTTARWRWNTARIAAADITDNVVDLMAARIGRLSPDASEALKLAACVGKSFSADLLARTRGWSMEATFERLQEAVQQGLILHAKAMGTAASDAPAEAETTFLGVRDYRFAHDRILEAARSLVAAEDSRRCHLEIARAMKALIAADSRRADLFGLVSHCNLGKELLQGEEERLEVAGLNLEAARRARRSLAVGTALECVRNGLALLPADMWERHRPLALALNLLGCECCQLEADKEGMDAFARTVTEHCQSAVERVRVLEIFVSYYHARRLPAQAVDECLAALRLLGISLPRKPGIPQILMAFLRLRRLVRGKPPEHFESLKPITDPAAGAAMRLIKAGSTCAYWSETKLIPLLSFKVVELTERHGLHPASPWGIGGYAFCLAGPFNKWDEGVALSRESLKLIDVLGSPASSPPVTFLHHMFISHWLQPCKSGIEACAAASLQALGAGDMESASMCRHLKLVLSFWGGVELPACEKEAAECIRLHERCGQEWFRKANAAMWHSLCALTGNHDRLADVWGGPFDMADYESASLQVGDKGALAVHHTLEMAFHVILGDVEEAEKHTAGLASNLEAIVSSPFHSAAIFFEALCLLAGARKRSGLTGREKRRIRGHRALLARWAGRCEIGFKHRRLLVEAEWERTTNPGPGTLTRYAEAIAAAQESKVVSEEALANELAGRYLVDLGMSKAAAPYLAQARYVFGQWGAAEKVRLLDEEFGALTARAESASAAWRAETLGSTMKESSQRTGGELDLASLLKSSRAISGEIVLDRLIQTTMGIVVENAGAQRGLFILKRESGWQVEAEIDVGAAQAAAPPPAPLPLGEANRDRPRLALGIVNYVLNSGRAVVLGDAAREGEFQSDEYVRTRRPKSILCTATRFRGTVGGIIYLENNDATQVFTEERVEVIDVLTSQIAVSLENALLFKAKEDVIAAYERFVPRQFLGYLGKRSILDVSLGDQTEREMTVLFSDIREFTSLSERMTPAENFEFINSYLSVMEPVIHSHGGFIDKYVGDAIMALFPTGPDDALAASMEMVRSLARLNSVRSGPGIQPIRIGIGLNSGRLMLGTVGGKDRMDGTVISDAVNLASRVEGMTKVFGATILASEHTFVGLKEGKRQPHRALGTVRVKGKSRPVTVFEFFGGEAEEQVALKLRTGDDFATAVQAYVSKRFIEADALFRSIVAQNPADRAAAAYLKRCRHYQDFGVPDDWNGVADLGSD